jgi:hypothetical protein
LRRQKNVEHGPDPRVIIAQAMQAGSLLQALPGHPREVSLGGLTRRRSHAGYQVPVLPDQRFPQAARMEVRLQAGQSPVLSTLAAQNFFEEWGNPATLNAEV